VTHAHEQSSLRHQILLLFLLLSEVSYLVLCSAATHKVKSANLMWVSLGLMSHLSSADTHGLRALSGQEQPFQPLGVHPSHPQGYIAGTLGLQGSDVAPPFAMIRLVLGEIAHCQAVHVL